MKAATPKAAKNGPLFPWLQFCIIAVIVAGIIAVGSWSQHVRTQQRSRHAAEMDAIDAEAKAYKAKMDTLEAQFKDERNYKIVQDGNVFSFRYPDGDVGWECTSRQDACDTVKRIAARRRNPATIQEPIRNWTNIGSCDP